MTNNHSAQQSEKVNHSAKPKTLTLFQTFKSVLWAIIGVQSKENLVRDFSRGKASHFIITGLVLVTAFVFTLVFIVNIVLNFAL